MSKFTVEETNLICIYNTGTRTGLIAELSEMQNHLKQDEIQLLELTQKVIGKLTNMNDEELDSIATKFIANFEE
ncbi:MAG: transposon-transfer assisting family protein [Sedimentibacter sp.]